MIFWIAIIVTVGAVAYTALVYIGNKGSFTNDRERGGTWWLIFAWVVVLLVWLVWLWLPSVASAAAADSRESILPPGMRTLTIVDLKREPDVRCVVPNCFTPPTRRLDESQRRFERRLLSPGGRDRLE